MKLSDGLKHFYILIWSIKRQYEIIGNLPNRYLLIFDDIFHIEMSTVSYFHDVDLVNNKLNSINFDDKFHKQNKNYGYNEYDLNFQPCRNQS